MLINISDPVAHSFRGTCLEARVALGWRRGDAQQNLADVLGGILGIHSSFHRAFVACEEAPRCGEVLAYKDGRVPRLVLVLLHVGI